MVAGEFKSRARRGFEGAFGRGELDDLNQVYSATVVRHHPPLADIKGLEPLKAWILDLLRAFSEVQYRIDAIALGDEILTIRWLLHACHTAQSSVMPIPPTGRDVVITGCSMAHCSEGVIEEEWCYVDWLGLFQQLNVIPPMG